MTDKPRLVASDGGERLVDSRCGRDHTLPMLAWARAKTESLATLDLDGCVLTSKSPSCGPSRVKIHADSAQPTRTGVGLFAAVVRETLPDVPVCESGWLHDAQYATTSSRRSSRIIACDARPNAT
jgi:uncharacterized protein YbbK (DUF523 family)